MLPLSARLALLALLPACVYIDRTTLDARLDIDGDGVPYPTDCAPDDARVHPGASETCDGVDEDCDGEVDNDATDAPTWYADADSDGHGAATAPITACEAPSGTVALNDDCDDADPAFYTGAPETDCENTYDYNCDGSVGGSDADGDGYAACEDCDDHNAAISPGATEDCSTVGDDNCDDDLNGVGAVDCVDFYVDNDGDGFGGSVSACMCAADGSYTTSAGGDCDDTDAQRSPGEAEVCHDGIDNDCDGAGGVCELADMGLATADARYTGEASGDHAGLSVAGAGDVNGDGWPDLVMGAAYNRDGGANAGAAYLVLGSNTPAGGSLGLMVEFEGESSQDAAGTSVAGAGDVNGDGFADLIVGAPSNRDSGVEAGAAYLVLGSTSLSSTALGGLQLSGEAEGDDAGVSVAGVGDVDGDGYDDVLVGAQYAGGDVGVAYLILGSESPGALDLSSADARFSGETAGDWAGRSVAGAGDVDGDGLSDMLVGAYGADDAGSACLFLGATAPQSSSMSSADACFPGDAGDSAGFSVAGAGDVNADGYADVLVGAYGNGDGGASAGAAFVVLGSGTPTSRALASADGAYTGQAGEHAGYSVAGAGDVDGDGFDDVLIGAEHNSSVGSNAGAAYLVLGSGSLLSASLADVGAQFTGEAAGDSAGFSVAGAGDIDGDGYADILVGAHGNGGATGAAYLILGDGI